MFVFHFTKTFETFWAIIVVWNIMFFLCWNVTRCWFCSWGKVLNVNDLTLTHRLIELRSQSTKTTAFQTSCRLLWFQSWWHAFGPIYLCSSKSLSNVRRRKTKQNKKTPFLTLIECFLCSCSDTVVSLSVFIRGHKSLPLISAISQTLRTDSSGRHKYKSSIFSEAHW